MPPLGLIGYNSPYVDSRARTNLGASGAGRVRAKFYAPHPKSAPSFKFVSPYSPLAPTTDPPIDAPFTAWHT
jgi:hypothetical protein